MAVENAEQQNQFGIKRVYVTDFSFELPQTHETFNGVWSPDIKIDLGAKNEQVNDDTFEVQLSLTLTGSNGGTTAFLLEIHQAGLFLCKGMEGDELHQVLNTVCPEILYPYAREAIDNMIMRGSFPALMLEPVNFNAIYAKAMQEHQEQQTPEAEST